MGLILNNLEAAPKVQKREEDEKNKGWTCSHVGGISGGWLLFSQRKPDG